MPENLKPATMDDLLAAVKANTEAVAQLISKMPAGGTSVQIESKAGFAGVVASDVQKTPFKSFGDFLVDVANASNPRIGVSDALRHHQDDALKALKATGSNEGIGSEGAFLVGTEYAPGLLQPMHDVGPFTSRMDKTTVGPNANGLVVNAVDETSRATGSRWGGVQGYHLPEAGTVTASKPKFRQFELRLNKSIGVAT